MSQRFLVPTNLFYYWRDPYPPEFPQPNTGDIYLNVTSWTLRVYYEGAWHDAVSGTSHAGLSGLDADDHHQYLTLERGDAQYVKSTKLIVSDTAPTPGQVPAGGTGTVWIEY